VSPNRREREYAKRRYDKWQAKQAVRLAQRRKYRRGGLIAGLSAVALVVVVSVIFTLATRGGSSASASSGTPSASGSASDNPCPKPTVKAPVHPKSWSKAPAATLAAHKSWQLTVQTTCGPMLIQLDGAKAPIAVSSTIFLAQQGFYNDTPCHRLTTEGIFVLQCGDPTGTGTGGPGYSYGPVENAPKNNVYPAGTVAMARQGGNAKSIGSQFFLVYKDSTIPSDSAGGYTVIGKITGGLGTLEKIAAGGVSGGATDGEPARAVSILSTSVAPG
jgi:peptidyl-prolyl cis-trans isomerase B (cyclophilin B)